MKLPSNPTPLLVQCFLDVPALGGIARERTAVFFPLKFDKVNRDLHWKNPAVFSAVDGLEGVRAASLHFFPARRPDLNAVARRQIEHLHGEKFLAAITMKAAGGIIYVRESPIGLYPKGCVADAIDNELREAQRLLGPFPLRDVTHDG